MSGPYCVTMANGNCGGVKTPPYDTAARGCFVGNGLDRSAGGCPEDDVAGQFVGEAFMPPGAYAAAARYTGGINPSPTAQWQTAAAEGSRPLPTMLPRAGAL